MENDELAKEIEKLIIKHPNLYYSMELDGSHIEHHPNPVDLRYDSFCDVFKLYNDGLFDSLRLTIRYEKSLKAWCEIIPDVDDESSDLKNTLIMDYVYPVFIMACNIPNTFKDQLVRGCTKIALLAKSNESCIAETGTGKRRNRRAWHDQMKEACSGTPLGERLCDIVANDLYSSDDAAHFRQIHGLVNHDVSQNLVSGLMEMCSMGNGLTVQMYKEPFNLGEELERIDRHRYKLQDAYVLFGKYCDALYKEMSGNNR